MSLSLWSRIVEPGTFISLTFAFLRLTYDADRHELIVSDGSEFLRKSFIVIFLYPVK